MAGLRLANYLPDDKSLVLLTGKVLELAHIGQKDILELAHVGQKDESLGWQTGKVLELAHVHLQEKSIGCPNPSSQTGPWAAPP